MIKARLDEKNNEVIKLTKEYENIKGKYEEDENKLKEVLKLMTYLDTLLEKLPVKEIKEFSKSENFEIYERILKG